MLEHGRQKFPSAGLLMSSEARNWRGIGAELRSHPAGSIPPIVPRHMEVTMTLAGDGTGTVHRRGDGARQATPVVPGQLWLCPVGVHEDAINITRPIEQVAHIYLPASLFDAFSAEASGAAALAHSIGYIAGLSDPLVAQIVNTVVDELRHESTGGCLRMEALALDLAAHLASVYGASANRLAEARSGAIDGVRLRRVLDHIAVEIESDLTVERLADIACLSRFHFSRAFKAAMGIPPHRYVSERRLEHAIALLLTTRRSLTDIAFTCRFSSPGNFSRAFARATGMSPALYRRRRSH